MISILTPKLHFLPPCVSHITMPYNISTTYNSIWYIPWWIPICYRLSWWLYLPASCSSHCKRSVTQIPKAHLSMVTSLPHFPSSNVLLAVGADFTLTIQSTDLDKPNNPVRVLRGHTQAITAMASIERGRTMISSSQDGSVRLWDVGSVEQIWVGHTTGSVWISAMALSVGVFPDTPDSGRIITDVRDVETNDKLIFWTLANGSFDIFSLSPPNALFTDLPQAAGAW